MDEFARIGRYWRPLAAGYPGARGLLDDIATLMPPDGHELIVTTDAIVENIHFLPADPAETVAAKLLRTNLSDLAAKGCTPLAYLLTTAFPATLDEEWIAGFADGLEKDQISHGMHLIGGDSVSTHGPIVLSMTAFGTAEIGVTAARSGARTGDAVYVTGWIGDAALGLAILRGAHATGDAESLAYLIGRYRIPQPRFGVIAQLQGKVTASMDVSDGLIADLDHICRASGVAIHLEADLVPFSAAARRALSNGARVETLLTGGDDYEIVFTCPTDSAEAVAAVAQGLSFPVTRIGTVVKAAQPMTRVFDTKGNEMVFDHRGWSHSHAC